MPSPRPLPIDSLLPELQETIRTHSAVVVHAPPGAGKTTRVPVALMDCLPQRIVMLEPRRVAARAAARRIAEEMGVRLGEEVGYRIRFETRAGPRTRLLVVTEGVLVRMLQKDPFLEGWSAVVLDEFHERSVHADLALAMTRRVQQELRDDLKLVVMSATLDTEPICRFLGGAPLVESRGRSYPVTVDWRPARASDERIEDHVCAIVRESIDQHDGDMLVFLPGAGEIRRVEQRLGSFGGRIRIHPLYGNLSPEAQDAAIQPANHRKIVLATNIAETSLTIEGVTLVVDSGLHRLPRFDRGVGFDRLELRRISQASAEQRRGRAGRVRAGHCLRLWSEAEHATLGAFDAPEIHRVDLSATALQLLAWGERDLEAFPFFESPAPEMLDEALTLLRLLGAVDESGVTSLGHSMAALPLAPRLGRLLLAGEALGFPDTAAELAALLDERDLLHGREDARSLRSRSDLLDRLHLLRQGRGGRDAHDSRELRDEVRERVKRSATAYRRALRGLRHPADVPSTETPPSAAPDGPHAPRDFGEEEAALRMLVPAFPDRVTQARSSEGAAPATRDPRGVMVGRRGVFIGRHSAVRDAPLYLSIELQAGRRGIQADAEVRIASAIESDWLPATGLREGREVFFDPEKETVVARDRHWYVDLLLEERNAPVPGDDVCARVLAAEATTRPAEALALHREDVAQALDRLASLRRWCPEEELPAADDDAWRALLPTLCWGRRSFAELRRIPADELLSHLLDWSQRETLDRLAPLRIDVPSGSTHRIAYAGNEQPVLAVRIQEVFGWHETPRIAKGRIPLLLHLLAPNRRPAQITGDLRSFWENTYPEVRKELRQRYPKHFWPEDPWNAPATSRTRKGMRRQSGD